MSQSLRIIGVAIVIILSACVSIQDNYSSDNNKVRLSRKVACGQASLTMDKCMKKGDEFCGWSNYQMYAESGKEIYFSIALEALYQPAVRHFDDTDLKPGTIVEDDITFKCKPFSSNMPQPWFP